MRPQAIVEAQLIAVTLAPQQAVRHEGICKLYLVTLYLKQFTWKVVPRLFFMVAQAMRREVTTMSPKSVRQQRH